MKPVGIVAVALGVASVLLAVIIVAAFTRNLRSQVGLG
jgi:hypothetical protein